MDEQRQYDELEPIYNSSVLIQDIDFKTYRERWTIGTGGEKESQGDPRLERDMMMSVLQQW